MSKSNRQNFMQGALILVLSNLIVKVIGACFKIPLTHLLHEEGMAIFNTAYQVYAALFAISTTGLPIAVSKMVAEGMAQKRLEFCRKVFRVSFVLLGGIGFAGSLVLFFGAPYLAKWMGDSMAATGIMAIAPALLFICLASCYRGFFQGMQNMKPTAISQLIEALVKLLLGFSLAYLLMKTARESAALAGTTVSYEIPAAGAIFGITVGIVLSAVYLMLRYLHFSHRLYRKLSPAGADTTRLRSIAKQLILIAVPITVGACVSSITAVVDTAMIRVRLQGIAFTPEQAERLMELCKTGLYDHENIFSGFRDSLTLSEGAARWLYGSYSGYASSLFNLPSTVILALGMSLVPAISSAIAVKNVGQAQRAARSSIRLTLLFALPCAAAFLASASPILLLILNNDSSELMLQILAPACLFVTLVSITTSILQASGHIMIPVRNMLIGGVMKVVLNYILVGNPDVHIFGASISTNLCYLLIAGMNLWAVKKTMGIHFCFRRTLVRPAAAAALMGTALWLMHRFLPEILPLPVQTILILGIGALLYLVFLFLLRAMCKEDIEMLPKGKKIVKVLAKYRIFD